MDTLSTILPKRKPATVVALDSVLQEMKNRDHQVLYLPETRRGECVNGKKSPSCPIGINLDVAASFLNHLDAGSLFTFQTFAESKGNRHNLNRIFHADNIFDVAGDLSYLNCSGAGVFVMVNGSYGKGRKASNVTYLRALFVDADGVPMPRGFHEKPDFLCFRDATHWHAYWLLDHTTPLDQFKSSQKALAAHYGTDPSVNDLPRVMRVPGFWHNKGEPTMIYFSEWPHVEKD